MTTDPTRPRKAAWIVWALLGVAALAIIIGASSAVLAYNTYGDSGELPCKLQVADTRFPNAVLTCRTATIAIGIRNGAIAALVGGLGVLILARRKIA